MQMSFWQDGMQEFIRTLILGKHGYKKITGKKCLGSASNTLMPILQDTVDAMLWKQGFRDDQNKLLKWNAREANVESV